MCEGLQEQKDGEMGGGEIDQGLMTERLARVQTGCMIWWSVRWDTQKGWRTKRGQGREKKGKRGTRNKSLKREKGSEWLKCNSQRLHVYFWSFISKTDGLRRHRHIGVGCNTNDFFHAVPSSSFCGPNSTDLEGVDQQRVCFKDTLAHGNFGNVHNLFLCFC